LSLLVPARVSALEWVFFKKLLPLEDKLWKPKEVRFKFQVVAVGPRRQTVEAKRSGI
jgi:hypothetical protein